MSSLSVLFNYASSLLMNSSMGQPNVPLHPLTQIAYGSTFQKDDFFKEW